MQGTHSTSTPDARRAARRSAHHHRRPLAPPTFCAAVSPCSPSTLAPLSDDRKWPHGHSVAIDGEHRSFGTTPPPSPINSGHSVAIDGEQGSVGTTPPPSPINSPQPALRRHPSSPSRPALPQLCRSSSSPC
jgi:hypothetical protein